MESLNLKFQLVILNLLFLLLSAFSQEPYQKFLWGPHFYTCNGVVPAWDGGFIFTDRTLAKITDNGNVEWAKNYKVNTWLKSIVRTHDGGYIATGNIYFINNGNIKIFTIKVDASGNLIWHKLYGSTEEFDEISWSICQTSDSNYLIAGTTSGYGMGASDIYLIKIDENGNVIWARTIGGELSEFVYKVKQLENGDIMVIGYAMKGTGNHDIYLIKMNNEGDTLWTRTYGGNYEEFGHDVIQTSDGGFAIIGSKYISSYRLADMMLVKTDSNGNFSWAKTYGGNDVDEGVQLWELPDHGFILAGQTESFGAGGDCDPIGPCRDYYLVRTDQSGDTIWTKAYGIYGSQDWNQGAMLMEDKGYLLFGQSEADYGSNSFLVKTDSNGYCPCNTYSTNTIVGNALLNVSSWGHLSHGIQVTSTTTLIEDVNLAVDSLLCLPVYIQEAEQQSIMIYPNPATTSLNIDFPDNFNDERKEVLVLDQVGRMIIYEIIVAGNDHLQINTSSMSNGFYLLRILIANNPPMVRKFIVN
jgi:hypothetical protein